MLSCSICLSYNIDCVSLPAAAEVADICHWTCIGVDGKHTLHVYRATDIGPLCLNSCCCTAGASALPYDLGPIDIGKARRTGQSVSTTEDSNSFPRPQGAPGMTQASSSNGATATTATSMEASSRNGPSTSSAAEDEGDEVSMMMLLTALFGICLMTQGWLHQQMWLVRAQPVLKYCQALLLGLCLDSCPARIEHQSCLLGAYSAFC